MDLLLSAVNLEFFFVLTAPTWPQPFWYYFKRHLPVFIPMAINADAPWMSNTVCQRVAIERLILRPGNKKQVHYNMHTKVTADILQHMNITKHKFVCTD